MAICNCHRHSHCLPVPLPQGPDCTLFDDVDSLSRRLCHEEEVLGLQVTVADLVLVHVVDGPSRHEVLALLGTVLSLGSGKTMSIHPFQRPQFFGL